MRPFKLVLQEPPTPWSPQTSAEHQWVPQGSLGSRATARCSRCGVVRRYQSTLAGGSVRYSSYDTVLANGPEEAVSVPACDATAATPSARWHWDVLTRAARSRL
jgi:hypothetical protein